MGTDGHRLALAEQEINSDQTKLPSEATQVIIPKKAATEIRRLLEEDDSEPLIGFTKNMLIFRKSGLVLTSRVMDGVYPDYQQVVPKGSSKKLIVAREELDGALRRVSLLSKDKSYAVKLTIERNRLHLFSSNPDMGEANEEIPTKFEGEGFSAGFNAKYILDILSVLEAESLTLCKWKTP